MGTCLSKKRWSDSPPSGAAALVAQQDCKGAVTETSEKEKMVVVVDKETVAVEESVKKEIFVIRHRKSHDFDKRVEQKGGDGVATSSGSEAAEIGNHRGPNGVVMPAAPVRTSSCTKEEVDAILIQCGRLSRSSSGKAGQGVSTPSKKYSGSKRSYDFDHTDCDFAVDADRKKGNGTGDNIDCCDDDDETAEKRQHRQRQRQSRTSPQGRRRTPSRERDQNRQQQQQQQQRSGSRDRGTSGSGSGGGRRVSRSPGRRSESTSMANAEGSNANRPGKMVSVPASVMDKGNNCSSGVESGSNGAVRRVLVKRNSGEITASGSRTPRSQSPANGRVASNDNQNQHSSLSRNPSRKAEQSPCRRNPLGEIDPNITRTLKAKDIDPDSQQKNVKDMNNGKVSVHGSNNRSSSRGRAAQVAEEAVEPKGLQPALTRTRSSRRSRDLDINPETLLNNPAPTSYTTLLLEDIQNFHQKSTQTTTPSISLPACVSKAHSILEAVADLNSCTSSNPSYAFSDDKRNLTETKDTFVVESEIMVCNDIMEPSVHKYVTVKRGTIVGGEMEEQESSGSNSFVGGSQLHSWEPNSADSTDCWTSRSNTREEHPSPVCFQRQALSEPGREWEDTQKRMAGRKRETDRQHNGIGRGRLGANSRGVTASIASM